jgi:hypothetical protein
MSAMLWRLMDACLYGPGGCVMCGDEDEFSPDIEAFEVTGKLICSVCFEGMEEDNDREI